MSRCLRCGQTTEGTSFGPDCAKVARAEMEAFCRKQTGQSLNEWFADCEEDFGSDEGITGEEYRRKYGRLTDDLVSCAETLMNHGLWAAKRRKGI